MSFLAPWFMIAGLTAVSLPVLFHLLRRTPRGRMATASAFRHFGLAQPKNAATPDLWDAPDGAKP